MNNLKIAKEFIEGTREIDNPEKGYGQYGTLPPELRQKMNSLAKGYIVINECIDKILKELKEEQESVEHKIWFIDMADRWTHDDYKDHARLEKESAKIREKIVALENAISGDNEND
jgi:hypothetical protein